jgi:mannose-1-phosphate guanylyltransferase/mannose-6-phosphate isomerase
VPRFVEKPDLASANRYLAEGGFSWNSGIFVLNVRRHEKLTRGVSSGCRLTLKASLWLSALQSLRADIFTAMPSAWGARIQDSIFLRPGRQEFEARACRVGGLRSQERCAGSRIDIRMVPLHAGWSDLGAWDAVWQHRRQG